MNPCGLTVDVIRYFGKVVAERRTLPVLTVQVGGCGNRDWRVTVYWGRGSGEVDFSLVRGYQWGPHGQRRPWRLDPATARALLVACEPTLGICRLCHQPTWFAAAAEAASFQPGGCLA